MGEGDSMRSLRGSAAARRLLGLVLVGHIAGGAFSAEDACVKVLHALCGNETASADLCLGCTTQYQPVFRAAGCASTETTQFCNQAAGSPVQPTVVARLLYDEVPSAHSEILVHAWDPKNHRLFSGGKDGQIHQWNISTQTRYPSLVQPANLSAPVTDLLVDYLRSKLLSSSTVVHQRSSNVTLPYPMLTSAAALGAPPPPKPAPTQHLFPVGGFACGKGTTCDDSAGQNALNISELTVQVLSDRVLAINVTCSPWHNRTFSTKNGEPFDNPHCYHIDDQRCTKAPASIKPERCCTGWQLYTEVRNYYCAEQYVSWEGTEMVFDDTPGPAASGEDRGPKDCFQEVVRDCGGYTASQGHYWFDRGANKLVWKLPYVQSHDNHGTVYGFANITMPADPNASIAMPADAQSKHVVAEWVYVQGGKLTPEIHPFGVLAGHDHSKDYANYSDDVVNTMALDVARGKLAVSVSDAVYHEHKPTLPAGGFMCIAGDPPWDTCGKWSGVELSRIELYMASHEDAFNAHSSVDSAHEARAVALNRTARSNYHSVGPPATAPINLTVSSIEMHWQRSGGPNNDTKCSNLTVSFNPTSKVMTFLDVDKPDDCLGKFLQVISADKFSMLWYREDEADSGEVDGTERVMLMASIMGEAVNASLRCRNNDCGSGTLGGTHMTAVPRDTILQWDVTGVPPRLGVPSLPTETSCRGANCTSGESVEGEVAVAMDIDTFYQKLYTVNHHRYNDAIHQGETWRAEYTSCNHTISQYSMATPKLPSVRTAVLQGHLGCVVALSVDSVNHRLYSASVNNTIIQWDTTTTPPTQLAVLSGFYSAPEAGLLSVGEKSHRLFSSGGGPFINSSTLVIWDTSAVPPKRTATIAAGAGFAFAYDDDKQRLMTSSSELRKEGIMLQIWQV